MVFFRSVFLEDCRCSRCLTSPHRTGLFCKPAQIIVNQALRAIMGHKGGDMAQQCAAMWRELDVTPVCAVAAARRARAIRKFPGLKIIGAGSGHGRRDHGYG